MKLRLRASFFAAALVVILAAAFWSWRRADLERTAKAEAEAAMQLSLSIAEEEAALQASLQSVFDRRWSGWTNDESPPRYRLPILDAPGPGYRAQLLKTATPPGANIQERMFFKSEPAVDDEPRNAP
jgi:hypothetical protein